MSIPGLGQIPLQTSPAAARVHTLGPLWEWRFEVGQTAITVRLRSGTAERDGTELALNRPYTLANVRSKVMTWRGCEIEVSGACDEYVAEQGPETPVVSYWNLHLLLTALRADAEQNGGSGGGGGGGGSAASTGPRVLVAGPPNSGRTTLVRTLAAWATRMGGRQACVVNADPGEGLLTLPGTLSAAVFGTLMDVESESGWGGAPSNGPAAVPVKLPLAYYYGREKADDDPALFRALAGRLAGAVTARLADDPAVRTAGLLIDAPPAGAQSAKTGVDMLAHIVEEFSVNIVVVLGSARLNQELTRRFASEKTSLGESIGVVMLDKSEGVVDRDRDALQLARESSIKEYFFGDPKRTLSPSTQQVDFDSLTIYKTPEPDASGYFAVEQALEKVEASASMSHWTLAVMNASAHDPPEVIRLATVMGFVYVADVDAERRRLKILAPMPGRLSDRPLVWGGWPEPYVNLLG